MRSISGGSSVSANRSSSKDVAFAAVVGAMKMDRFRCMAWGPVDLWSVCAIALLWMLEMRRMRRLAGKRVDRKCRCLIKGSRGLRYYCSMDGVIGCNRRKW